MKPYFIKINCMDIPEANKKRTRLNKMMMDHNDFFKKFGIMDDEVYSGNAIPKKYKELSGLSISVFSKCNECILYHIQGCLAVHANKQEIVEAIKIGVIGGGSVTYPNARYAFEVLEELKSFS
jgi:AhpD family alkylhydroperoxidase